MARLMLRAQEAVRAAPDVRVARTSDVRGRIESGELTVDAEGIAERLTGRG